MTPSCKATLDWWIWLLVLCDFQILQSLHQLVFTFEWLYYLCCTNMEVFEILFWTLFALLSRFFLISVNISQLRRILFKTLFALYRPNSVDDLGLRLPFLSAVILTFMIHRSIYNYFPRCHNTFSMDYTRSMKRENSHESQLKFGFLQQVPSRAMVFWPCACIILCTSSVISFENIARPLRRLLPDRWSTFRLPLISYMSAAYLSAKYMDRAVCAKTKF
jgi:hypothetical protein